MFDQTSGVNAVSGTGSCFDNVHSVWFELRTDLFAVFSPTTPIPTSCISTPPISLAGYSLLERSMFHYGEVLLQALDAPEMRLVSEQPLDSSAHVVLMPEAADSACIFDGEKYGACARSEGSDY